MFKVNQTRVLAAAIAVGVAAVALYAQTSALEAGEPDHREMIATTDKAVWHLKDGRLRYCMLRSSEIFCIEEK